MADSQGEDNQDTIEALGDYPRFKVVKTPLVRRKVWANAASAGLGIIEYKPLDKKALNEFNDVINEILK